MKRAPNLSAYCFVDGGHVRAMAKQVGKPLVDPRALAITITYSATVQYWRTWKPGPEPGDLVVDSDIRIGLDRVIYFDARRDDATDQLLEEYWRAVELLPDTELGFGSVRGRPRRQKKVDGLIAVDMLGGAFAGLFQVAILVSGDADFVPVVDAVRRTGVMVVVASTADGLADELRREADRVWILDPAGRNRALFPPLLKDGTNAWYERDNGKFEVSQLT
ncbi:MAG TPA: NYN domain-containing protein [Thermoanaerobaculia bacterium]|nr:NYN domain-containing protein [Thermoanaerobaculia bacterium]